MRKLMGDVLQYYDKTIAEMIIAERKAATT